MGERERESGKGNRAIRARGPTTHLAHAHLSVVRLHAIEEGLLLGTASLGSRSHLLLLRRGLVSSVPGEALDGAVNGLVGHRGTGSESEALHHGAQKAAPSLSLWHGWWRCLARFRGSGAEEAASSPSPRASSASSSSWHVCLGPGLCWALFSF